MEKSNDKISQKSVHGVLARSYFIYFLLFLLGVYLDLISRFRFFSDSLMVPLGATVLLIGSALILWAQRTSHNLNKDLIGKNNFCRGPYCYTRSPTHLGLFLLIVGYGIITNSFFIILATFISLVISKFFFLDKAEKILAEKYGSHYLEYKKSVKF